jgi:hypothetical protein
MKRDMLQGQLYPLIFIIVSEVVSVFYQEVGGIFGRPQASSFPRRADHQLPLDWI